MSETDQDLTPRNEVIVGDYRLGRKLGKGGWGVVYEAEKRSTGLRCAVKLVDIPEDPDEAERLSKQAQYPAEIAAHSIHVLGVIDFFPDPAQERFCIVTEFIPHGDLRQFLENEKNPNPLPLAQSLPLALGIARGLAAIHEMNIAHLDLKPGNILMDQKDGAWVPRITDFGLARSSGSLNPIVLGSPDYAAPEQMSGEAAGKEADLFAFGMILYELLTGKRVTATKKREAYRDWLRKQLLPPPPSTVRPELAAWKEIDALIPRLLEHDAGKRKANCSAVDAVRVLQTVLRDIDNGGNTPRNEPAPSDIRPDDADKMPCPRCGEIIRKTAKKCPRCREFLDTELSQQRDTELRLLASQAIRGGDLDTKLSHSIFSTIVGMFLFFWLGIVLGPIVMLYARHYESRYTNLQLPVPRKTRTLFRLGVAFLIEGVGVIVLVAILGRYA